MSNSLNSVFSFKSTAVRTIADDRGEPWFSATDVCAILGYRNPWDATAKHCREGGLAKREVIDELGRQQEMTFINEGNLYRLIVKSRKPEAEAFEQWVMEEVLPAIRKTGQYVAAPYSASPGDALTKEQADSLRQIITRAAEKLPAEKRGAFIRAGWSKLKSHFKVGYRQIPATEFTEAVSLITRHAVEGEYLPREEHASLNQTVEHWAKQIESGNGVPAEVFEPIARAVLKKKPNLNNENAPISESDLLAAAQKALCAGHRFYTIFREGSAPGEILPILVPLPSNCHMLTPQEVVEEIASNGTGFFKDGHIKDIICAIGTRLKAA